MNNDTASAAQIAEMKENEEEVIIGSVLNLIFSVGRG